MQLPLHQNSQTKGKFIIIIQYNKIQNPIQNQGSNHVHQVWRGVQKRNSSKRIQNQVLYLIPFSLHDECKIWMNLLVKQLCVSFKFYDIAKARHNIVTQITSNAYQSSPPTFTNPNSQNLEKRRKSYLQQPACPWSSTHAHPTWVSYQLSKILKFQQYFTQNHELKWIEKEMGSNYI